MSAIINFLQIPFIYLGAVLKGEKPPITLSRNATFLYSAAVLGLTITAIAFPPSALIIALVSTLAVVALNIITLVKIHYRRYALQEKLKIIENTIEIKINEISELIHNLEELEDAAKRVTHDNPQELQNLIEQTKIQLNSLQLLYDDKEKYKEKEISNRITIGNIVGITLAFLALIGVISSLIFPPLGIGILMTVASIGFAYLVGRVTYPLFKSISEKIYNYLNPEDKEKIKEKTPLPQQCSISDKFNLDTVQQEAIRLKQCIVGSSKINTSASSPKPSLPINTSEIKNQEKPYIQEESDHIDLNRF